MEDGLEAVIIYGISETTGELEKITVTTDGEIEAQE